MNRIYLTVIYVVFSIVTLIAQDGINIKSFKELSYDLDARIVYAKTDQNGKTCALVKVVTTEGDFTFDNGYLGVVAAIHKPELAEWWVYLPEKTMKLKIMHPVYGQLNESDDGFYYFPNTLKSATTYRMELTTRRKIVTYEPAPLDREGEIAPSTPTPAEIILQPKWSAEITPIQKQVLEKLISNMVKVDGGTFMMGATPEQGKDVDDTEKPAHQVTLDGYYIGKYEVTQEEWEVVMGNNPSKFKGLNLPVEKVSWDDCQEFIAKLNELTGLNFSLPTEAQWEYAARGGNMSKGYKYPGSDNVEDVAWYKKTTKKSTQPVGTKEPNELGLYDMGGNVSEWCSDWFDISYYSSSPSVNPMGPASGMGPIRVVRGGSWYASVKLSRVSFRFFDLTDHSCNYLGLRLVAK